MIHVSQNIQIGDLKSFLSNSNLLSVQKLCKEIFDHSELDLELTVKRNYCSIVTDGTAILGLGNIGPWAGSPVMEGKICLFKQLSQINVIPICLSTKRVFVQLSPPSVLRYRPRSSDSSRMFPCAATITKFGFPIWFTGFCCFP